MATVSLKHPYAMPLPASTSLPPRVVARKSQDKTQTATRICEWCDESISEKALKCPLCQKWRKDIVINFQKTKKGLSTLAALFFCVSSLCFWAYQSGLNSGTGYPWYEKVYEEKKEIKRTGGLNTQVEAVLSMVTEYLPPPFSWQFSTKKFLSSGLGWIVMSLTITSIWYLNSYIHNLNDLKRKTGLIWLD